VVIRGGRLYLYKHSKLWKDLPARVIIIDATANVDIYRQLFPDRKIEVYEPPVTIEGSIYQVTGSYNGIGQFSAGEGEPETKATGEMIELIKAFCNEFEYQNPGIVTFKSAVPHFAAAFPNGKVAHFGGQRGSNELEDCDAGFIVGTFSPPDAASMDMVRMLWPERLEPFAAKQLDNGMIVPLRTEKPVRYEYLDEDGRYPTRVVSGLWNDPHLLAAMESRREAEMVQAAHRLRPLTRQVPIWIFSSVATGLPLAGVWDDPPLGPEGIYWKSWLKIKKLLDEKKPGDTVTLDDLAAAAGVARTWASSQKWLTRIAEYYKPEWEEERILRKKVIVRA